MLLRWLPRAVLLKIELHRHEKSDRIRIPFGPGVEGGEIISVVLATVDADVVAISRDEALARARADFEGARLAVDEDRYAVARPGCGVVGFVGVDPAACKLRGGQCMWVKTGWGGAHGE